MGQIKRETVSVVKTKRNITGQFLTLHPADLVFQQTQTATEHIAKAGFFMPQGFDNQRTGAFQFGISGGHLALQLGKQLPQKRFPRTQHMSMAHGAPHNAPQHIAAPLIRRQNTVGNEEGSCAQMIGNDSVAHAMVAVCRLLGKIGRGLNQMHHQIRVVIVVLPLQHCANALQPHARIDRGFGQENARTVFALLELHENEVPNLDEPVTVFIRTARRSASDFRPVIVKNFRTRPARSGVAHRPEIVGRRNTDDALLRQTCDFLPQAKGFIVFRINRGEQLVGGQP